MNQKKKGAAAAAPRHRRVAALTGCLLGWGPLAAATATATATADSTCILEVSPSGEVAALLGAVQAAVQRGDNTLRDTFWHPRVQPSPHRFAASLDTIGRALKSPVQVEQIYLARLRIDSYDTESYRQGIPCPGDRVAYPFYGFPEQLVASVQLRGQQEHGHLTLIIAATDRGPRVGFWAFAQTSFLSKPGDQWAHSARRARTPLSAALYHNVAQRLSPSNPHLLWESADLIPNLEPAQLPAPSQGSLEGVTALLHPEGLGLALLFVVEDEFAPRAARAHCENYADELKSQAWDRPPRKLRCAYRRTSLDPAGREGPLGSLILSLS